ncbi:S8 family serine peptidase [Halobaculum sp. CBA1158]|uniref:S8 family serine peptidase n=1 Tax=Halobaculum sp. CBA1158 TaxID=2904243 RepID=UPI001F35B6C8|nr:S8 family serine peptidase [Halobaculum sp. CBA1158]UIO99113.1 S8 family serine peptidase [Halobaculum sp. CBA1158]
MSRSPAVLALAVIVAAAGVGLAGASVAAVGGDTGLASGAVAPAPLGDDGIVPPPTGGIADADGVDGIEAVADDAEEGDGDPIRVGVIGSGFGGDRSAIDGRVAGRYDAGDVRFGLTADGHDTAVASVVADRADDAALYLATVGYRPTPAEYERAVEWLVANDADVIVDAGSYYPQTAAGRDRIGDAVERAADAGSVVVTSGGNTANRHWRGDADEPGWLAFDDDGTQGNRLGDGPVSGRVTLRLYWAGDANYDLYLYRDTPGEDDPVVAKSTRESGRAEAIDAVVPRGNYYVGVYARDADAGPVDLFAARHRLTHAAENASGPLASTPEGVISVGAVAADGGVADYSPADTDVRGPGTVRLDDGRRLEGTSAAAPAVAGVAARMAAEADDDLAPGAVERLLRTTANDGRVDPAAAVAAAERGRSANGSRNETVDVAGP